MEHSKQLIKKAKGKLCKICMEYITETEADNCEFEYSLNSSRREVFVHSRCWEKENCK